MNLKLVIIGTLVDFAAILLESWVLYLLWTWFLVPLGAPKIGVLHVAGIGVTLGFAVSSHKVKNINSSHEFKNEILEKVIDTILSCLVTIFIGGIIKLLM